jgi:hypothetical protein
VFEHASGHHHVTTRGASMGDSPESIPTRLSRGEAEIGFQQVAELIHVPGITFVGTLPAEVQPVFSFAGALTQTAQQPEAAGALLRFIGGGARDHQGRVDADRGTIAPRHRQHVRSIYFSDVLITVNFVLSAEPTPLTAVMIAIAMPAAIRPYSMAVAPVSSFRNLEMVRMANAPADVQRALLDKSRAVLSRSVTSRLISLIKC